MAGDTKRPDWELSLDELVEHLKLHTEAGRKVSFLIGSGVSASAGIPTAPGIVEDIAKGNYQRLTRNCNPQTYPACMGCLPPMAQRELLMGYVKDAKLNAAHLYLAAMVKKGLVERILTVNFDPLMVNALVYSNEPPYVYDVANLAAFTPKSMATPSVVHLHGQLGALVNLHSTEQVDKVKPRVHSVLQDTLGAGPLVVVGYSGENDPVFEVLCEYPGNTSAESACFPHGLYWVQYEEAEPRREVLDGLLKDRSRYAHCVRGQDADTFFMALATKLGADRPVLIGKPFTFLKEALSRVADVKDEEHKTDLTATAQKHAGEAIGCFEEQRPCSRAGTTAELKREDVEQQARLFALEGRQDESEMDRLVAAAGKVKSDKALHFLARAVRQWGYMAYTKGVLSAGNEAIAAFRDACVKFRRATELKPDYHEAYNNWGAALGNLGQRLEGDEARQAFRDACEKYRRATELKPDKHEAFNNWGAALGRLGQRLEGEEAIAAFRDACEKFRRATELKPDKHEAFNNWGAALGHLYRVVPDAEKPCVLAEAREKLEQANKLRPGYADYNLACVAALEGKRDEALRLLESALKTGRPSAEFAEADWGFESLKEDQDFKAIIEKHRKKPKG